MDNKPGSAYWWKTLRFTPAMHLGLGDVRVTFAMQQDIVARIDALEKALQRAVDLYGKPGGPWNVPSDPGGWLAESRAALGERCSDPAWQCPINYDGCRGYCGSYGCGG